MFNNKEIKTINASIYRYQDRANANSYFIIALDLVDNNGMEKRFFTDRLFYGYGDGNSILLYFFDNYASDLFLNKERVKIQDHGYYKKKDINRLIKENEEKESLLNKVQFRFV